MNIQDDPAAAASAIRDPRSPYVAFIDRLSGAPLDFIKTAAAFFMVLDHFNTIAFPLFCFAVACHAVSGRDSRRGIPLLLIFAVVAQPVYAWAFQGTGANILFTLAAGVAIAGFLPGLHPALRHAALAVALAACWLIPAYADSAPDYGLAGMVLPAALALAALGGRAYWPWALAFAATVNAFPHANGPEWWVEPAIDAAFVIVGGIAVVAASTRFAGQPRFLSRYALHVFYPGHLALLAILAFYLRSS
jgi:hypothetical protein